MNEQTSKGHSLERWGFCFYVLSIMTYPTNKQPETRSSAAGLLYLAVIVPISG